jgi:hypothetical protein
MIHAAAGCTGRSVIIQPIQERASCVFRWALAEESAGRGGGAASSLAGKRFKDAGFTDRR